MYILYADIYFLDKDGKEITDKSRNFVVGSHKLAKTMIECAADCIREVCTLLQICKE